MPKKSLAALIIDEDPIFQLKLRNILPSMGYEVAIAESLEEANTRLETAGFDLLVCEAVVKEKLVFDLENFPAIPTVFVTAHEVPAYMERALQINDALFLVKPLADLTFKAAVKHVTKGWSRPNYDFITVFGKYKNPIHLPLDEIEFVTAEGNYSYITTTDNRRYAVKKSAKQLMSNVDMSSFLRTQRSTYVNKSKLVRVSISAKRVFTKKNEFEVSRNFKKSLYEFHLIDDSDDDGLGS